MGRNRIRVGVVVLAMAMMVGGCAAEPSGADQSRSASPRPTASASPAPSPTPTPTEEAAPEEVHDEDDGHGHEENGAHPPADPSLTAATAYSSCVAAGRSSLFTDDPGAAWQPMSGSFVEQVDGVWRVHSGVTTTSAEGAGTGTAAYCQVSGSESAPTVLTMGVTLAPPTDPGLWALPEG